MKNVLKVEWNRHVAVAYNNLIPLASDLKWFLSRRNLRYRDQKTGQKTSHWLLVKQQYDIRVINGLRTTYSYIEISSHTNSIHSYVINNVYNVYVIKTSEAKGCIQNTLKVFSACFWTFEGAKSLVTSKFNVFKFVISCKQSQRRISFLVIYSQMFTKKMLTKCKIRNYQV